MWWWLIRSRKETSTQKEGYLASVLVPSACFWVCVCVKAAWSMYLASGDFHCSTWRSEEIPYFWFGVYFQLGSCSGFWGKLNSNFGFKLQSFPQNQSVTSTGNKPGTRNGLKARSRPPKDQPASWLAVGKNPPKWRISHTQLGTGNTGMCSPLVSGIIMPNISWGFVRVWKVLWGPLRVALCIKEKRDWPTRRLFLEKWEGQGCIQDLFFGGAWGIMVRLWGASLKTAHWLLQVGEASRQSLETPIFPALLQVHR